MTQTFFAHAKLNLFLAITGRRPDGFHELVSLVAPITLSDELAIAPAPAGEFRLTCDDPELLCDESNLVLKAARAFAQATGWHGGASFALQKRIPMGAGLGGGSSDAVAALRGLNRLAGNLLDDAGLGSIAATLGSDCPLFLREGPVVMRGRGEKLEELPAEAAARLRGRHVLVFKPAFGIPTAWAYRRMAELSGTATHVVPPRENDPRAEDRRASVYLAPAEAERRLTGWIEKTAAPVETLLFNNLEIPAFDKFIALPELLEHLSREFKLAARMSGSGSACFAFLPDRADIASLTAAIRAAWGGTAFVAEARIA